MVTLRAIVTASQFNADVSPLQERGVTLGFPSSQ